MKKKNVQIPEKLLIDLWNYHLMNIRTPELEQHIQEGLQEKYNSIKRRIDYQKKKVTHENNNTDI